VTQLSAIAGRDAGRAAAVATELGPGALGLALDVRDESSVRCGVDQVYDRLGGLEQAR
jgi:hypothetical protein